MKVTPSNHQILNLGAVVVAFFLCWAPFHAQRLGYVYFKHDRYRHRCRFEYRYRHWYRYRYYQIYDEKLLCVRQSDIRLGLGVACSVLLGLMSLVQSIIV